MVAKIHALFVRTAVRIFSDFLDKSSKLDLSDKSNKLRRNMEKKIQTIAAALVEGARALSDVEMVVTFSNDKALQITMSDGEMFNVSIVKTQNKIQRKPVYQKENI